VIGMGTGGTISGTGRYLKEQNPNVRVIGVDPDGSILKETWKRSYLPAEISPRTYKVEGIGEDFLPSTLDLAVIDEVIQVGDKESFNWARRLVKEEGIFCGGSAGSALAGAIQVGERLNPDQLLVVILPDSGSRYLSKFYDDKWMRENGFMLTDWCEASLKEVLSSKPAPGLITACETDGLTDVIATMKAHGISQMPVVHPDETLAGLVTEIDLLKYLVEEDHLRQPNENISAVMRPLKNVYPADTSIETVLTAIMDEHIILVMEENHLIGILTKIDLLDFITQGI
jgi:cystathionine beta-synthase